MSLNCLCLITLGDATFQKPLKACLQQPPSAGPAASLALCQGGPLRFSSGPWQPLPGETALLCPGSKWGNRGTKGPGHEVVEQVRTRVCGSAA